MYSYCIDIYLLYKAEKPSVCLSAIGITQLSQLFQHGLDLVYVIAVVSGTSKFIKPGARQPSASACLVS